MLKHNKKLKDLCLNKKGTVDLRKMKSKAFTEEMQRLVNQSISNMRLNKRR